MTGAVPPAGSVSESFAARVRQGAPVCGTFVKLAGFEPIDLVRRAAFDFAVVDIEHSQLGLDDVGHMVRHASAVGLPSLVRIPSVDAGLVNRLLEAGAAGIQLSSVTSTHQARALRAAMRYAPEGTRSVSAAQPAAGYGDAALGDYLAAVAADPPLVVGQIETASTEDPLDEVIAALDVVFVGTTDLSVDLELAGQVSHPAVLARIGEIAAAAARCHVPLGGWAGAPGGVAALRERGASYLVVGSDLQALRHGLASLAGPPVAQRAP